MNADELRVLQSAAKARYRDDPASAVVTLRARGTLMPQSITCRIEGSHSPLEAGLHPAAGGDGTWACSGEMLLESLVACAGVTLGAVATAMGIAVRGGTLTAEGDLDFRGTLGVDRAVAVGLTALRLRIELDTDADADQLATLLKLTERYCVIYQTLKHPAELAAEIAVRGDS